MVRTIISLEEKNHAWLIKTAQSEHVSMTEIVRRAIEQYRLTCAQEGTSNVEKMVRATKGIWKHGDGLSYQKKIRSEWE